MDATACVGLLRYACSLQVVGSLLCHAPVPVLPLMLQRAAMYCALLFSSVQFCTLCSVLCGGRWAMGAGYLGAWVLGAVAYCAVSVN
jgi:hypothetical protein